MFFYSTTSVMLVVVISIAAAVKFNTNPTSDMSTDEENSTNKTTDILDESGHEVELDEDVKEKKYLKDAMKKVLDPTPFMPKTTDVTDMFRYQLDELENANITLDTFMEEMDKLSLDVCKTSQEALWSYVTDINNEVKKNKMVLIAAEEDEIKKQYWNILKKKYLNNYLLTQDTKFKRKIRIIKERGTNVQMPQNICKTFNRSLRLRAQLLDICGKVIETNTTPEIFITQQREEIDTMQKIWRRVTVCAYNVTNCNTEDSVRTMSDIITTFKVSNDSKELAYYWLAYRDATGRKIRPIFKDYVERMNSVAKTENFTDAGDMWRYAFEDDDFANTVDQIWSEIKPFYDLLQRYVRTKLKAHYADELLSNDSFIPAHLLGNLWAQEWQTIYPKVVAYPDHMHSIQSNQSIKSKQLFDAVDDFHQSVGFDSARESYKDIRETITTANCLPSSHDMCDGTNYKIKWCGEKVTDVVVGLSRAARLLGHVQYFKHYRNLPPLYRDGPNPAFHDAISDIVAIQLTSPDHLKSLNLVNMETGPEVTLNHLLWMALEKFPLMAYAYVLDKWRWDVFGNSSLENLNEHWWNLRTRQTGVSPPVPRNESDLDPAAKYHVVSHVQYITYLVSHVLEFQILLSLCKQANHTGPLHECSIYGSKKAGKLLSDGMSLGASQAWRTVLKAMTGEAELSTTGILEYFAPLREYLTKETTKRAAFEGDMDRSAPIIVGAIVVFLTLLIVLLYCVKKQGSARKLLSLCGLSKNGSLDIVTNEIPQKKNSDIEGVSEDKV